MKYKLSLILLVFLASPYWLKSQDSLAIQKIAMQLFDQGVANPVYTDFPYFFNDFNRISVVFKNNSRDTLTNLNLRFKLDVKDSNNAITVLHDSTYPIVTFLKKGELDTFKMDTAIRSRCKGNYTISIKIETISGNFNDSLSYFYNVSDSTVAKDLSDFNSETGPTHFMDTIFGKFGGDTTGDRFGTLFRLADSALFNPSPSSISFHISNDSNNIGVSIKSFIWACIEDSINHSISIDSVVAGSGISTTISSSDLGRWKHIPIGAFSTLKTSLEFGDLYLIGWEVVGRSSNSKYFEVSEDTNAQQQQPPISSFVYFGHASSQGWTPIDALPSIRLNFRHTPPSKVCSYIVSIDENVIEAVNDILLYPNPVTNYFYLETESEITNFQLFNSLGQQFPINYEPTTNGFRFDTAHLPKGIYVLHTSFSDGNVSNQKFIKAE